MKRTIPLLLAVICLLGSCTSPRWSKSGPEQIDPAIREYNRAFARAVLEGMNSNLRSLKDNHEEMGYIDYFTNKEDRRDPIFACVEFTYKPLVFPNDGKRFMDGGYRFGLWLWDLGSGRPKAIEGINVLPLGLGHNGVSNRGELKNIGIGISGDYDGDVPVEVKKVVDSTLARMRDLQEYDFWQRGADVFRGGIFVVRSPVQGDPNVTLAFGIENPTPDVHELQISSPHVVWTIDGGKQLQIQRVGVMSAQAASETIRLGSQRAILFAPCTISLGKPGAHKVAAVFADGRGNNAVAKATISIDTRNIDAPTKDSSE